jgi:hypothetical protein
MSNQQESHQLTRQGITTFKAGDKRAAATLFHKATQLDPNNQTAWLWLSGCVDSDEDKRTCLERVIAIDPNNEAAKRAQERLNKLTSIELPDLDMFDNPPPTTAPLDMSPMPKTKKSWGRNKIIGYGILAIFLMLCCCGGLASTGNYQANTDSKPTPTTYSTWGARWACQDFVRARLKAPSTAKFPCEETVFDEGEGSYTVQSCVDAQNAFGAILRKQYICSTKYQSDTYVLTNLVIE